MPNKSQHSSPRTKRRNLPSIPVEKPAAQRVAVSPASDRSVSPSAFRQSITARKERRYSEASSLDSFSSREDLLSDKSSSSSLRVRNTSESPSKRRASDARAAEYSRATRERLQQFAAARQQNFEADVTATADMFVIKRGESGRHRVNRGGSQDNLDDSVNSNGKTSNRFQISADKLLPNKMKNFTRATSEQPNAVQNGLSARSYSTESNSDSSIMGGNTARSSANHVSKTPTNHMTRTWSQDSYASNQSEENSGSDAPVSNAALAGYFAMSPDERKAKFGSNFNLDVTDFPEAPAEDEELNRRMEELFEEYRKVEKGSIMEIQGHEPTPRRKQADVTSAAEKSKVNKKYDKVKSRIRDYLENQSKKPGNNVNASRQAQGSHHSQAVPQRRSQTPNPVRAQAPTSRRSQTPTPMSNHVPVQRRSQTPTPSSYTRPMTPTGSLPTSGRTTPTTQRRNLPKTPNRPNHQFGDTSSQHNSTKAGAHLSSTSSAAWGAVTPRVGLNKNSAWKRLSRSTTDLTAAGWGNGGSATMNLSARPSSAAGATQKAANQRPMSARTPTGTRAPMTSGHQPKSEQTASNAWCTPAKVQANQTRRSTGVTPAAAHARKRSQSVDRRKSPQDEADASACQNGARRSRIDTSRSITNDSQSATANHMTPRAGAPPRNSHTNQQSLRSKSAVGWLEASQVAPATPEVGAKPRKDKVESAVKTRIPLPTSARRCQSADPFASGGLKRYDSGVDINNMSPTESSCHGDIDATWSQGGVALIPQAISCLSAQVRDAFADDDGEFF